MHTVSLSFSLSFFGSLASNSTLKQRLDKRGTDEPRAEDTEVPLPAALAVEPNRNHQAAVAVKAMGTEGEREARAEEIDLATTR